jgi:hypothetical protein
LLKVVWLLESPVVNIALICVISRYDDLRMRGRVAQMLREVKICKKVQTK